MSRALASVCAETGFWPPGIDFTARDLMTVLEILQERSG